MTSKEQEPWPTWNYAAQHDGYSANWWTVSPSVMERLAEASRKNEEGNKSSASHSWEPAAQEQKRARSVSPAHEGPSSKRMRITLADASADQVDKSGNIVKNDTKWILQDDPCALGHPVTQAMWLVVEPSYNSYGKPWFRPATQLSEMLEAQLQADIGCQMCILEYPKEGGETTKHFFEHDLRGSEWVQRMYHDEGKRYLKSSKQLIRVMVG